VTLDFFLNEKTWRISRGKRRGRRLSSLDAIDAPAGEMPVVLVAGWPGILLAEAVGHGLKRISIARGSSAFSGGGSDSRWRVRCAP
jgi:TldD protein